MGVLDENAAGTQRGRALTRVASGRVRLELADNLGNTFAGAPGRQVLPAR